MKIAICVAHRLPSLHYAETVLPRGFARIGASTWVLTSDLVAPSARGFVGMKRFRGPDEGELNVIRFPSLGLGNLALSDPTRVMRALSGIRPDVVLSIAPTKGLPFYPFVFGDCNAGLFAQVGEHMPVRGLKAAAKRWIYERIFEKARAVFASKDESEGLLMGLLGREVNLIRVFLPFDERVFYYDPAERERVRAELGLDGPLVISAARITPYKGYEALLEASAELGVSLILVGLREGDPYCESIRRKANSHLGKRFLGLPFRAQEEIRPLFNAADIGVWPWTSVSIKQALGTGLPVVMWRPRHLIEEGVQGYFIAEATREEIAAGLAKALSRNWDREALANLGQQKYSSVAVARRMREIMESRL
ncbi:MAG: glycosyltransferase family 4 protein [candidate division WOR-3 bacterium]